MTHTRSVQIGPEFFRKTFNDYSSWQFALMRELLQNSLEAPGSRHVQVMVTPEAGNTRLVVANDGAPMTEDELVNKLLSLGGSGQDFQGTVGGYGRAKELIYYCNLSYQIRTGAFLVTGCGAGYDLESQDHFAGTESSILIAGDQVQVLRDHCRRFISLSHWKGTLTLDEETLADRLKPGKFRRDLGWAKIHTNKTHSHLLLVTIGGMPMFPRQTSYQGCVYVELTGKSSDVLQSSRDGLKWPYAGELDRFLADLTVNRRKALRPPQVEILHYPGAKLQIPSRTRLGKERVIIPQKTEARSAALLGTAGDDDQESSNTSVRLMQTLAAGTECRELEAAAITPERPGAFGLEFIVKNDTGMAIPAYYLPDGFSAYARILVQRWRDILLGLALLLGRREAFALGFFFSADLEAAHEKNSHYGHILYVNPVGVVRGPSGARSLCKRWRFDAAGCWKLLATALHEWTHLEGYADHDEAFSSRLTDVTALVLQNLKRFGRLFDRGGAIREQ